MAELVAGGWILKERRLAVAELVAGDWWLVTGYWRSGWESYCPILKGNRAEFHPQIIS